MTTMLSDMLVMHRIQLGKSIILAIKANGLFRYTRKKSWRKSKKKSPVGNLPMIASLFQVQD